MIFLANITLATISYAFLYSDRPKRFEVYRVKMETLFKATRYERIVQNVRNGYGILNYSIIHFCNEQFCNTLGAKTKAQAIHLLKQISRKSRQTPLQAG
jgi:hypothetical protein